MMNALCTYYGMPKGTEATSSSKTISFLALAVIELLLSEGISK